MNRCQNQPERFQVLVNTKVTIKVSLEMTQGLYLGQPREIKILFTQLKLDLIQGLERTEVRMLWDKMVRLFLLSQNDQTLHLNLVKIPLVQEPTINLNTM